MLTDCLAKFIVCADGGANRLKDLGLDEVDRDQCVSLSSDGPFMHGELILLSFRISYAEIWTLYFRRWRSIIMA